jgi:hypothetical protein
MKLLAIAIFTLAGVIYWVARPQAPATTVTTVQAQPNPTAPAAADKPTPAVVAAAPAAAPATSVTPAAPVTATPAPEPAAAPKTRPEFVLGASFSEWHQTFGTPDRYWDVDTKSYLHRSTEYNAARELGHRVIDVYTIQTAQNTYEFQLSHHVDDTQSRLHPTARLVNVIFELDRPVPVADLQNLLADMPEAARMCSGGCTVYSRRYSSGSISIYYPLSVQPTAPTTQELQEASEVHTLWGSPTMVKLVESEVELDHEGAAASRKPYQPSKPVKTIELKVEGGKITGGIFGVEEAVGTGRDFLTDSTSIGTWQK